MTGKCSCGRLEFHTCQLDAVISDPVFPIFERNHQTERKQPKQTDLRAGLLHLSYIPLQEAVTMPLKQRTDTVRHTERCFHDKNPAFDKSITEFVINNIQEKLFF